MDGGEWKESEWMEESEWGEWEESEWGEWEESEWVGRVGGGCVVWKGCVGRVGGGVCVCGVKGRHVCS